jgi:hypothetical protein
MNGLATAIPASQKAQMCRERAAAARQRAESGLSLAEREEGRAAEQHWLRLVRLYELMDEVLASVEST